MVRILLSKKNQVQYPASSWWLTIICNSSSSGSDAFRSPWAPDRVFTSPGHQWNYVDQPGIKSQRSACLYLPITGLEGVHYYAGLNQRKLIREYVCEEKKVVIKWKSKTKLKTKTRKTQIEKHWKSQDDLVNLGSDKYFSCVCLCIHSCTFIIKTEICD